MGNESKIWNDFDYNKKSQTKRKRGCAKIVIYLFIYLDLYNLRLLIFFLLFKTAEILPSIDNWFLSICLFLISSKKTVFQVDNVYSDNES